MLVCRVYGCSSLGEPTWPKSAIRVGSASFWLSMVEIGSPTRNSVPSAFRIPVVLLTEKIAPWPSPLASIAAKSTFEFV